jgi:hypothetical protein
MRNANTQLENIMIRVGAVQQPPGPHVSHAEIGGWQCAQSAPHRAWANHGCEANRKEIQNSAVL